LSLQGPYDILYQMLEGFILLAGVPGTAVEMVLPTILAASLPYLMGRFVLARLDIRTAILTILATPGWYAIYRLQADLHADLLALTLFLAAVVLISQAKSLSSARCLSALVLIGLASFTHIESILFLMTVTVVSSLSKMRPFPMRAVLAGVVTIIPATVFYMIHILQLLSFTSGSLEVAAPQAIGPWLVALGPLLPLVIVGLVWSTLRRRSWLETFAATWGVLSIIVGLSQYVSPQTVIFAQRAIILTPTPLLAGLGAMRLSKLVARVKTVRIPTRYLRLTTIAAVFLILALSWPVTVNNAIPNEQVYLTSGAYKQLQWVSANVKFSNTPIFMFNDADEYAGGLAQLYDNWVSATVGPHLSYLGLIDYLVQMEQTPYSQIISVEVSGQFMQQLTNAGITTRTALLQHPIVIMSDFYRPYPLPNYTSTLFTQLSPGIFVDNPARLESLTNVTLPLYVIFGAHSGGWYGGPASWAESIDAYQVYDSVPPIVQASFLFRVNSAGNYTLGLRYLDSTGNDFTVAVDGNRIGTIAYNNTGNPAIRLFTGISLTQGTHTLTITISNVPSVVTRYASLDYLTVSPT
jgi:hypothetical protein